MSVRYMLVIAVDAMGTKNLQFTCLEYLSTENVWLVGEKKLT